MHKPKNGQKILVAYDSEAGSTGEIADFIGNVLSENGYTVEIIHVRETVDLTSFDGAIIGSPIRYDKWMPNASKFVKNNQEILSEIPVAFFYTCLVLAKTNEKTARQAKVYSDKIYGVAPQVKPVIILRLRDKDKSVGKEGDYRDWDAIRSWVESIDFG
ncbi:MAG: flavodoxin domain-containing protein [Candidatus Thorarchaeota archaeon]|jgi:menaquinone-dependent protoporphyrinogen oxidase